MDAGELQAGLPSGIILKDLLAENEWVKLSQMQDLGKQIRKLSPSLRDRIVALKVRWTQGLT